MAVVSFDEYCACLDYILDLGNGSGLLVKFLFRV